MITPTDTASHLDMERIDTYSNRNVGVLILAQDTGRILIAKRSELVEDSLQYSFFGGAVDNGEYETETSEREVYEEAGITLFSAIKPLAYFENKNSIYTTMITIIPNEIEPELNWEHDIAKWVSLDQLKELGTELHKGVFELLSNEVIFDKLSSITDYYINKTRDYPSNDEAELSM